MKSKILEQNIDSRGRFVDIVLENLAVAAARVVELPSRNGLKGVQKTSMFTKRLRESFLFRFLRRARAAPPGPAFNRRENPIKQALFGEYIYIYIY